MKTVKRHEESGGQGHTSIEISGERTQLPWGSPGAFRTIPSHTGRLHNPHQHAFRASSDAEAAATWLAERAGTNKNTASAYRKEVERLLLWLADQGMTLSDATREDYVRFAAFLQNPTPKERWISSQRYPRNSNKWRPFQGPLTPQTARQSLTICRSLISYLQTNGWLTANTMPEPKVLARHAALARPEQIALRQIPESLMRDLESYPRTFAANTKISDTITNPETVTLRREFEYRRLELIIALAGTLGARSSDLLNAMTSNIIALQNGGRTRWTWLLPNGKGNKDRSLPVPDVVMEKVVMMRVTIGLPPYPQPGEPPYPLLPSTSTLPRLTTEINLEKLKGMSRSGLYRLMDRFFTAFASSLKQAGRHSDAQLISSASLHWLRHTAGKRILNASNNNLTIARRLLNHASIQTTADYVDANTDELAAALDQPKTKPKRD